MIMSGLGRIEGDFPTKRSGKEREGDHYLGTYLLT